VPETCSGNYKSCGAWGDPHWTAAFYDDYFDFMGLGLFDLAATKDGYFQLQGYMSPYKKFGTSIFTGFAMKLGDCRMTIIRKNYTINGKPFTDDAHAECGVTVVTKATPKDRVQWTSPDKCSEVWIEEVEEGKGVYYYTFYSFIHEDVVDDIGVCGAKKNRLPVHRDDSLFPPNELDYLCKYGKMADCTTFKPPPDWKPLTGPQDACAAAGISFEKASAKCAPLKEQKNKDSCIFDYCASDGVESVVANSVSSEKEIEESIPPPSPCTGDKYCPRDGPGQNHCAGERSNILTDGISTGMAECKARCNKDKECKFMSFWKTGGKNWCRTTKNCDVKGQQSQDIVIQEKPTKEVLKKGPGADFCAGPADNILTEGASKGQDDCNKKCEANSECKFISYWTTGGQNFCRLTKKCDVIKQQPGNKIIISEKA